MTTQKILENIMYFLSEVLPNGTENISWSISDIQRAFSWASYLEKLYHRAKDKPFSAQLNRYIEELVVHIPNCIIPNANYQFLKHGQKFLMFLLILNTKIEPIRYCQILDDYIEYGKNFKDSIEMPLHIVDVEPINALLDVLGIGQNNYFSFSQWQMLGSGLLLHNLSLRMIQIRDSQQCEKFVISFLEMLVENLQRLQMLLKLSLNSNLSLRRKTCKKLQKYVVMWICNKLKSDLRSGQQSFTSQIIAQPPAMLTELSSHHTIFLESYLNTLLCIGRTMVPKYLQFGYSWENNSGKDWSFMVLVAHFTCLLKSTGLTARTSDRLFQSLALKPGCSIWNDIHSQCLTNIYEESLIA